MKKKEKNLARSVLLFVCLFFALSGSLPVTADAKDAERKTIRVGWYEDSYHITGENGERSGYGYEYEQAVAAYTGWKYEYVTGDWSELLDKLQNGEIDMMAALSYTGDRAKKMLFSELPMGEEKYYLYADLAHTDISASDLSSLNGKRIVVMEKSVQATQFAAWEKKHKVKTKHKNIDSFEKAKEMAKAHQIDGVISTETPAWVENGMSAIATVGGSGIYYGINKRRPDLKKEMDQAMRAMEYDKPFYSDDLYKKYLTAQSVAILSSEEKEWLSEHGAIRIGYLNNDTGVSYTDKKTGKLKGVINDYIEYAKNCLNNYTLSFQTIGFDTRQEQFQALKDHKIDMIFHVSQNPSAAQQNDFALSNTVWTFNLAAITAKDHFSENEENTIALKKDNFALKWYISYNYPKWKIIEYHSEKEVEKAVKSGKADGFIAGSSQVRKYIDDQRLQCVFLMKPGDVSFAVNRGNTLLLSILNKTLKAMPTSMLTGAISMYDSDGIDTKISIVEFIKENVLVAATVFLSVFIIVLTVILVLLRKAKRAELEAQNAKVQAENANAAKTNFLFNMSHDIRTPMNALLGYNQLMKKELSNPKLLGYQEKMEQAGSLLLSIINNVLDMARIESGKIEMDENYSKVGDILDEICGVFDAEAKKRDIQLFHDVQVTHVHILCDETKIKEIFTNLVSNAIKYTASGGRVIIRSTELEDAKEGFVKIQTEVLDTGIGMSQEYIPHLFESFTRERNTTTGKVAGSGLGMAIVKKLVDLMDGTIEVESELGKGTKFTVILPHRIADKVYYEQEEKPVQSMDPNDRMQGRSILLAEDNDLNAEIAMTILEGMDLVVERVEDGVQCVNKIEQMDAGSYDMILMDIQMPNMDGYKATDAIRHLKDPKKADIPIIAMTANAFEEDKKMALVKGMNGHITKPINVKKTKEVMLSVLRHSTGSKEDKKC